MFSNATLFVFIFRRQVSVAFAKIEPLLAQSQQKSGHFRYYCRHYVLIGHEKSLKSWLIAIKCIKNVERSRDTAFCGQFMNSLPWSLLSKRQLSVAENSTSEKILNP